MSSLAMKYGDPAEFEFNLWCELNSGTILRGSYRNPSLRIKPSGVKDGWYIKFQTIDGIREVQYRKIFVILTEKGTVSIDEFCENFEGSPLEQFRWLSSSTFVKGYDAWIFGLKKKEKPPKVGGCNKCFLFERREPARRKR